MPVRSLTCAYEDLRILNRFEEEFKTHCSQGTIFLTGCFFRVERERRLSLSLP